MGFNRNFRRSGGALDRAIRRCFACGPQLHCPVCNRRLCDKSGGDFVLRFICWDCKTEFLIRHPAGHPLTAAFVVRGDANEVTVECSVCDTFAWVRRPQHGPIAQQFGIRPLTSPPATVGSG